MIPDADMGNLVNCQLVTFCFSHVGLFVSYTCWVQNRVTDGLRTKVNFFIACCVALHTS